MNFTIRPDRAEDCCEIRNVYKSAFAGPHWFETLTHEEVLRRWSKSQARRGFAALVAVIPCRQLECELVVGSHWREIVILADLIDEWGDELGRWVRDFCWRYSSGEITIVWERHLSVSPSCQRQGVGTALCQYFLDELVRSEGNFLVLTRMRRDNFPAIRTAEKVGFIRAGVARPSRSVPNVVHEFWYCVVRGRAHAENVRLAAA